MVSCSSYSVVFASFELELLTVCRHNFNSFGNCETRFNFRQDFSACVVPKCRRPRQVSGIVILFRNVSVCGVESLNSRLKGRLAPWNPNTA